MDVQKSRNLRYFFSSFKELHLWEMNTGKVQDTSLTYGSKMKFLFVFVRAFVRACVCNNSTKQFASEKFLK
jgi:hypothetical protein